MDYVNMPMQYTCTVCVFYSYINDNFQIFLHKILFTLVHVTALEVIAMALSRLNYALELD